MYDLATNAYSVGDAGDKLKSAYEGLTGATEKTSEKTKEIIEQQKAEDRKVKANKMWTATGNRVRDQQGKNKDGSERFNES